MANEKTKKFRPGIDKIYYAQPVFGKEEKIMVAKCLERGWLGPGQHTIEFEKKFADFAKKKHCIVVNSGSSANLLALTALNLPRGSEVITPACTFPTTFNPILQNNLVPVVGDVELDTYNLDLSCLEKLLSKKTKAVMLPHALGNPNDMVKLRKFADKRGLYIVEDSCDTIGSKVGGFYTGHFGDVSTFSFYASHHITLGGGGGAVLTDSDEIAGRIRSLKDWGRADDFQKYWTKEGEDIKRRFSIKVAGILYDSKYTYTTIGFNKKTVEMQAAFGLAQFEKLPRFNKIRENNIAELTKFLKQYENFFILPKTIPNAEVSWLAFPIMLKDKAPFKRFDLLHHLESRNIQTRLIFAGNILRHPAYKKIKRRIVGSLENSDKIMKDAFLVPIHQGITKEKMEYIKESFSSFFKKFINCRRLLKT